MCAGKGIRDRYQSIEAAVVHCLRFFSEINFIKSTYVFLFLGKCSSGNSQIPQNFLVHSFRDPFVNAAECTLEYFCSMQFA